MSSPVHARAVTAEDPFDVDALVTRLGGTFAVSRRSPRRVRRATLDTFDNRLARSGLRLEHVAETNAERLELTADDDHQSFVAHGASPRWPSMAQALSPGPLRDHVAAAAGIRALMVQESGRHVVHLLELRNEDAKIVARVQLEEPDLGYGPGGVVRATLRPLRGYDKEARKVEALLTAGGMPAVDASSTAVATSSSALHVDPSAPAVHLLGLELRSFLQDMRVNLPGLLDDVDTEFLHDFRVAVRRSRSTLKLGTSALGTGFRDAWEPELKWLGDLTTPVRDLDVYQLDLPRMAGWLVGADPADLEPFRAHLARRRTAERRALVRGLRSSRYSRFVEAWSRAIDALLAERPQSALAAGRLAAADLRRAHRRVARGGAAITDRSPSEDLHRLRKRCKELRYALEVFAPVVDPGDRAKAVADLKDLQDVLGRFQDSEVQRNTLRRFAEEMMAAGAPAPALLAMGELVGHLDAEQARAREQFSSAFARFSRPASTGRLQRLGGGS